MGRHLWMTPYGRLMFKFRYKSIATCLEHYLANLKKIYNVVRCSGLVQIDHESQLCLSLLSTHLNQIQGQVIFQVLQPAKGCYACCWLVKIIFFSVKCFSCNFLRCGFFFHLWWKKMEQFVLTLKKWFDQQAACWAPVCWSKYTTYIWIESLLVR